MNNKLQQKRSEALQEPMPFIAEHGWNLNSSSNQKAHHPEITALFPGGAKQAQAFFFETLDRQLLEKLHTIDPESLRVRDRIKTACLVRFQIMAPYRAVFKKTAAYDLLRLRLPHIGNRLWKTADMIWTWAGDTATDYNRYTKRGLLCGILTSATVYWLRSDGNREDLLEEFLDRRIENVMQLNKITSKYKK